MDTAQVPINALATPDGQGQSVTNVSLTAFNQNLCRNHGDDFFQLHLRMIFLFLANPSFIDLKFPL